MKIIDCGGKYPGGLALGLQVNLGSIIQEAHRLAQCWAPARARSYSMELGDKKDSVWIVYYTRKAEGSHQCNGEQIGKKQ